MGYAFGCLCAAVIPVPRRDGDRHFADHGGMGLYLGPSEVSPGHVVYLFAAKVIQVVAKIRVWEDQFPGLKGHRYSWFPSSESLPPDSGIAESTSAPPVLLLPPVAAVARRRPRRPSRRRRRRCS